MRLAEFVRLLKNSTADQAALYSIQPYRRGKNLTRTDFVGAGLLRLRKDFGNLDFSYSLWMSELRKTLKTEAGRLVKNELDDLKRFRSLEILGADGEYQERTLISSERSSEDILLIHEQLATLERTVKMAENIVDILVQKGKIPKTAHKGFRAIVRAYMYDPHSLNGIREDIAPELARQRISEWWNIVRKELAAKVTRG